MLNAIKNLYNTQDLRGEIFLQPLKTYQNFFGKKITEAKLNSDTMKVSCWKITQATAGIFVYPIFGLLALVGMGIKLADMPELIYHNYKTKLDLTQCEIPQDKGYGRDLGGWGYGGKKVPHDLKTVYQYDLTINNTSKQNALLKKAKDVVDDNTFEFKKVYLHTSGQLRDGAGAFQIKLQTI